MMRYNADQRREYLEMTERLGRVWIDVFQGDTDFYSAVYWDLLSRMWKTPEPVRKTDALRFMTSVKSAHTAGKYMETALQRGFVVEQDNPDDARSKLVSLSDDMRARLDAFFDSAVGEVRRSSRRFDILGPSPEDP